MPSAGDTVAEQATTRACSDGVNGANKAQMSTTLMAELTAMAGTAADALLARCAVRCRRNGPPVRGVLRSLDCYCELTSFLMTPKVPTGRVGRHLHST